jgi:alkylation response protein AidB-like acyl-CoA dehydrogenase
MIATSTASELVSPVADAIRSMAAQAEAERRIPDTLFTRLKEAGLFAIYTPREFGGLDLPLPESLRVVEEVSRHDGSTGWTVGLGIVNSVLTCALPDASAARVLHGGSALIAGSPAFGLRATREEGGYRLTGQWRYNSGAPNADWIGVAVPRFEGDQPVMDEHAPAMILAFFEPKDVEIIDTWYVTGLRASGTQDLYAEDLFVPEEMTGGFALPAGPQPERECVVAGIPFFSLLGIAQSPPVCLGIARHAIEEFSALALAKESAFGGRLSEQVQAHVGLARAEALLESARSYWYEQVEQAWDAARQGRDVTLTERASIRLACLTAVENSVAAVDMLYRLAGTSAIFQSSPLERCWRDVHTAAQHMQVQDGRWETAGRVLFGLDPMSPII